MEDNRTFKINFSYWSYWIWSKGHFVCRPSFGSWIRKSTELTYTTVYAINAIKAGGYTADTFKDTEINQWAHDTAKSFVKCRRQNFCKCRQYHRMAATYFLVQKPGYDDVTEAVDKALHKLPAIAQRSTGSFCTPGFETGCMSYGNNAWNDAQAMLLQERLV